MQRYTIVLFVSLALCFLMAQLATAAQQGKIPLVGMLTLITPADLSHPKSPHHAFRQGLRDLGYVEGQNILLEYRFAERQLDRLPALAAELVQRKPDVIVTHSTPGALALKQATTTIPIVVAVADDLVNSGIVASLAQPGGNITGQNIREVELVGKRLEVLKAAVPTIAHVAFLVDAANSITKRYPSALEKEARALGVWLQYVDAGTPVALDDALVTIATDGADALMLMDISTLDHRRILDFARTHRLPTACAGGWSKEVGCLIAYSPNHLELFRHTAVFVDKILKGAKPADLPVELPHKLELVINLMTAEALGLTLPPTLLFRADKVIK